MNVKNLGPSIFPFIAGLVVSFFVGCSGFDKTANYQIRLSDAGAGDAGLADTHCSPVQGQPIPARLVAMSKTPSSGTGNNVVFVDDLFNQYKSLCGGCHVEANQGNLQVSRSTFATLIDQTSVDRMESDDPNTFMPPVSGGGVAFSTRGPQDPVVLFDSLLKQWIAAGRPNDVFYPTNTSSSAGDAGAESTQFMLSSDVGNAMSNIGACLPDKSIVGAEQAKMDALDSVFAQLSPLPAGQGTLEQQVGLPPRLEQTDLFTLDTATLARYGVIAYAPGYPLWSDDAGKLRLVRVPRGQSISFDQATQTFNIPANTRFYKTFLKKIIDTDGSTRYRKIETRLIVSRPDTKLPDGTNQPTAIFGTYVWNDDETAATLMTDPLRNGQPFSDRLITYVTDEPGAAAVRATNPYNLTYALDQKHLLRRYAIPGSDRCLDCHMGSPSQSFVLGFTPLQLKRRPVGQGGVIDPAAADELTQLQRLIDYGVITGVNSPDDIANLEDSQGSRKPRNDQELTAQAYMVGNCAHCHNPRGEPSVDNPELATVLNFLPGPNGGVFQFPLETFSPRITRGPGGNVPVPYITPSLMEYPVEGDTQGLTWVPKADGDWTWPLTSGVTNYLNGTPDGTPRAVVFAPWRSLIYRNVNNPFAYSDDYALFPHMPKHVPGYDCRTARIMGDWMVSIPARRKNTNVSEFAVPVRGYCKQACDHEPQPYEEVLPGDSDYDQALSDVQLRIGMYHSGQPSWQPPWYGPFLSRYNYCPDTSDIIDPAVENGTSSGNTCSPQQVPAAGPVFDSSYTQLILPNLGVPLRAHWVVTDLTDLPGDWYPRRSDWQQVLVQQTFPQLSGTNCSNDQEKQDQEKHVVQVLQNVSLTQTIRSYALKELPFGLWVTKPECASQLSSVPTVAQYTGATEPKWMNRTNPDPSSPVYTELPGAAVFNMICINCHGPQADSHGRLADNLMTMTGGSVRVANLRDGLFGPVAGAGANRVRVFGDTANSLNITSDDMASRYLAWMALGGTSADIPPSLLNIVGNTQVLGVSRKTSQFESATVTSANMLATAQELCRYVLPMSGGHNFVPFDPASGSFSYDASALIAVNGDAELWQNLCSIDNPPPVRAVVAEDWTASPVTFLNYTFTSIYKAAGYPPNTPIGDQNGNVAASLQADNLLPWCIISPTDASQAAIAKQYVVDHAVGGVPLPFCPTSLLTGGYQMLQDSGTGGTNNDLQNWATRGAINAGLAVFLYLDQVVAHGLQPKPAYDHCELLGN